MCPNPPSSAIASNGSGSRSDLGVGMQSGSSDNSYARNSRIQGRLVSAVESVLWESLASLPRLPDLAPGETSLRIADLGCAIGSNTVRTIDKAVSHISALLRSRSVPVPPEVQAFYNDLPGNDFNTLFRSFPPYRGPGDDGDDGKRNYFVAGVPGSFHDRLFPSRSIHAFTCVMALHFLSRIPDEVTDRKSPAFNKGHIAHDGSSVAVRKAFSAEFVRELTLFLTARSQELVSGGLVVAIICGGHAEVESEEDKVEPRTRFAFTRLMDESAQQLVAEGALEEDAVDMFNMPMRFACLDEVRTAVEACGLFHPHVLESHAVNALEDDLRAKLEADPKLCAKVITGFMRTVFSSLMDSHFGREATELLIQRYSLLVEQDHTAVPEGLTVTYHLLVLSRK